MNNSQKTVDLDQIVINAVKTLRKAKEYNNKETETKIIKVLEDFGKFNNGRIELEELFHKYNIDWEF